MAIEIERKYLINQNKWDNFPKPEGQLFRQGYILKDPEKTIRVRVTDTTAYLTIKGASIGATRTEFEYEIPKEEGIELLDNFAVSELSKIRYKIPHINKLWEVDVFLGNNKGLIVAEIELDSEEEYFELPEWISIEVTGDNKYYNSNLSANPFKNW
ncbi:CYTH domain-containing protein [Emticicia sp. BO119]|uniref:CYTH domain-containing protein n=1 Tax=Emticicia sp. BO119 TaxID=2757768 RepID=UPI0015F04753|nr:CYTH domain-containing protein [Emticicia sp. BO119]MBA4853071.1 CYTH domain-containing protein [Emticicia sp. BO119]